MEVVEKGKVVPIESRSDFEGSLVDVVQEFGLEDEFHEDSTFVKGREVFWGRARVHTMRRHSSRLPSISVEEDALG